MLGCWQKLESMPLNKGFDNNYLTNGAKITGSVSGATGIVYFTPQDKTFDKSNYYSYHWTQ